MPDSMDIGRRRAEAVERFVDAKSAFAVLQNEEPNTEQGITSYQRWERKVGEAVVEIGLAYDDLADAMQPMETEVGKP